MRTTRLIHLRPVSWHVAMCGTWPGRGHPASRRGLELVHPSRAPCWRARCLAPARPVS